MCFVQDKSNSKSRKFYTGVVGIFVLCFSQFANAYSTPVGLSLGVGTLGVGLGVTYNIDDWLGVRITGNSYEFDKKISNQGVKFDADIELVGAAGTLDWYPFSTQVRFSAGLISNSSHVYAIPGDSTSLMEVNDIDVDLSEAGLTEVDVTFSPYAAYLGVGWGNAGRGGGLSLFTDLGLVLQGAPDVDLSMENQAAVGLTDTDIRAQEKYYESKLKSFRVYPVLTIGISYNL